MCNRQVPLLRHTMEYYNRKSAEWMERDTTPVYCVKVGPGVRLLCVSLRVDAASTPHQPLLMHPPFSITQHVWWVVSGGWPDRLSCAPAGGGGAAQ
jgi:hypothetical protein